MNIVFIGVCAFDRDNVGYVDNLPVRQHHDIAMNLLNGNTFDFLLQVDEKIYDNMVFGVVFIKEGLLAECGIPCTGDNFRG